MIFSDCVACKKVAEYAEKHLDEILVVGCKSLPNPAEYICDKILDKYGIDIVEWLRPRMETHAICKKIGMCPKSIESLEESLPSKKQLISP